MKKLEEALIEALSRVGNGEWFSLEQVVRSMSLPSNFVLRDDVERLVSQRLHTWNWYCHRGKWCNRFVRRNHETKPRLIMLANRKTVKTSTSWPPFGTIDDDRPRRSSALLDSLRRKKRSEAVERTE